MIHRIIFTLTALVMVSMAADLPESGSSCDPSSDSQTIVDSDDCTVFVKCVTNQDTGEAKWISSKCIDGTIYSAEKGRCDAYIGDNACQGYTKPAPSGRDIPAGCEDNFLCPNTLAFYVYPDWQDCTKYYVCQSGAVSNRNCNAFDGLTYYSANDYACVSSSAGTGVCLNGIPARP
ncbi:hypothetical protein LOTGIDRAFT_232355 [Lottia gigantea]|uniref:Chitin-binding type-2 domain-containing protein n=1 Tax=Lottia gigantea TaxID=225164 RepID=V4ACF7_LOTGI|nr:hypothetical protein LOTGIDRAFT_232355 [Lottia gigantea]ESO94522.1 hypothetical protein LOTGIDRAFT_232355 [Lottia gigantea]